jgi:hypothetical protein
MQPENITKDLKFSVPFGVEIELNSFDLKSRPDGNLSGSLPLGTYDVAFLVNKFSGERVFVSKWCNNHDNNYWVVKPDSSCGLEVCSPVLRGLFGAKTISQVIESLRKDSRIRSDSRCSYHVHFDVSSLSSEDLLSIISWWIKLESFFMDAMPIKRKVNPYCRLIAQANIIDSVFSPHDISYFIEKLGTTKYYTLNTFHYHHARRKSLEFRIMDNSCCLNPDDSLCWISLLHHFINCSISSGPPAFLNRDPFSGYCWLDPLDAFKFLNFDFEVLSPRLSILRSWLLKRLLKYGKDYLEFGIFSRSFKSRSYAEVCKLEKIFQKI